NLLSRLHYLPTGKQPLWFTFLEKTFIENNIHCSILSNYQPRVKLVDISSIQILYQLLIGLPNIDTLQFQLYPLSPISCMSCPGCNLNTNHLSFACTIEISATLSTLLYGKIQPNKQLNLNANYIDPILSTAI
ncbi:17943_t:CDS:2, partial [Gigaspora margarita]